MHTDKKYFSIGEVAKLKNITPKTLRYYHDIGLLIPSYIDESNGYRYYALEQLIHIDIIKIIRNSSGSIKELKELYSHSDMDYLVKFFEDKNNEVEEKIKELQKTKLIIKAITDKVKNSQDISKKEGFKESFFSERYLITSPLTKIDELKYIFDYYKLGEKMNRLEIISSYEEGIFYSVSTDGELNPKYVFEVIDKESAVIDELNSDFIKLPKGYYLTYTVSKESYEVEIKKILNYLYKNKIDTEFVLLFELYNDFFNINNYYYQVQIYIGDTNLGNKFYEQF